jgi:hypothetical protein
MVFIIEELRKFHDETLAALEAEVQIRDKRSTGPRRHAALERKFSLFMAERSHT